MEEFKSILVVTNSSSDWSQALHYGLLFAKSLNARLQILHVMHNPFTMDHWQLPLPYMKGTDNGHAPSCS
jgi:hypothetical protein